MLSFWTPQIQIQQLALPLGIRKQIQERSKMTGENNTKTGGATAPPVAYLSTMMSIMQNLMDRFEQKDASNNETNKWLDALAAACTQPLADELDPKTERRQ